LQAKSTGTISLRGNKAERRLSRQSKTIQKQNGKQERGPEPAPFGLSRLAPNAKRPFIREKLTKELALDRDRNRSYTERMHRDAKEMLVGLASLLVFGIALVVWPPFGVYIHDAIQALPDLIASFF
jgi:hypothetical protein